MNLYNFYMKYKKHLGGLFVLLGFTWQVFDGWSSYTPTEAILVVIFAYPVSYTHLTLPTILRV